MSKRFGRARKRKMREALAAMTAQLDDVRVESQRQVTELQMELATITRAIEEISPHSAALPIKGFERENRWDGPRLFGPFGAATVSELVLHKLRMKAVRDDLQRAVVVRAEVMGKSAEFFLTEEALVTTRVRDAVIQELCARTLHAIAKRGA